MICAIIASAPSGGAARILCQRDLQDLSVRWAPTRAEMIGHLVSCQPCSAMAESSFWSSSAVQPRGAFRSPADNGWASPADEGRTLLAVLPLPFLALAGGAASTSSTGETLSAYRFR